MQNFAYSLIYVFQTILIKEYYDLIWIIFIIIIIIIISTYFQLEPFL
jgi:hypothetical protein